MITFHKLNHYVHYFIYIDIMDARGLNILNNLLVHEKILKSMVEDRIQFRNMASKDFKKIKAELKEERKIKYLIKNHIINDPELKIKNERKIKYLENKKKNLYGVFHLYTNISNGSEQTSNRKIRELRNQLEQHCSIQRNQE